jgi:hypothetical protein
MLECWMSMAKLAAECSLVLTQGRVRLPRPSAPYLGSSNEAFDAAMGKFALAYADQVEPDYAALKTRCEKARL